MKNLNDLRAADARAKIAYFDGLAPHPHGKSGERWLVPYEGGKNMWDTSPEAVRFSEYGNAAGAVP